MCVLCVCSMDGCACLALLGAMFWVLAAIEMVSVHTSLVTANVTTTHIASYGMAVMLLSHSHTHT